MSLLNPWVLLGLVVALASSFVAGMSFQDDLHQAALLVQERVMREAYVAKVREYRATAQAVAKELNDETTKRQGDAVAFRDELRRARSSGKALATCEPGGTGFRLTSDFSRLYDSALQIGMPDARDTGRVDAGDTRPDPVEPAEVLAVHGENAEAWAECRAIGRGWQALARRHGWVQ